MITTAKNKKRIDCRIEATKGLFGPCTHTGPVVSVAKEVAKYGSRVISVTIIETK